ncbi:MAG: hypothetical protein BMS9Abin20_0177 [Acidimicrobiia bacterium]|nr:MAG: hypothetical protein BMS9Abin20_0177 [Acidimicrobiia bacterium]
MSSAAAHGASFVAIVVAAGSGTRYGRPKHDLILRDKPLWRWSADTFLAAGVSEVVVVGDVPGGVPGGPRRRDSVRLGLEAVATDHEWVLIHDAARPLVLVSLVHTVMDGTRQPGIHGVIPVTAITDTIKQTNGDHVLATVDRRDFVAVQTPQAFRTDILRSAHLVDPDDDATDDASLVERAGGRVVVVEGDASNLKITFPGDLVIAEAILAERER